ncbi:hypothetical protein INT45_008224 [Circinella minor]|uniref:F-box domain-containing protein n=1 Tax=Circinella minor TaxID=1195481 RepID=A0A8H7S371_9FUNG|nr:hypothetical protein INT45_008224 [Circinella minor]
MKDIDSINNTFSKIDNAINNNDYEHAVEFASTTIDAFNEIKSSLFFTTLDHRSFALGQLGKLDMAINDAQEMIKLVPTSPKGYNRLGNLYSIQGKQQKVIETYEHALNNIILPVNDPTRLQIQQQQNIAKKQNNKRVDFISNLPSEIVFYIFAQLSQETKSACLHVSTKWRKCLLNCPNAWSTLRVKSEIRDNEISRLLSHIAPYAKTLILKSPTQEIWSRYLHYLTNGQFTSISYLYLTVCQELRVLKLDECSDKVFALIPEECLKLEILIFNHEQAIEEEKIPDKNIHKNYGLRELYIRHTYRSERLYPNDILSLVDKHQQTLEILNIDFSTVHDEQQPTTTTTINSLRLQNLRQLMVWTDREKTAASIILRSIANSNSLINLTAIGGTHANYDIASIVNTVISLPFIKVLELKGYIFYSTANQESLLQLFNNFSSRGAKSTLERVHFEDCAHITADILLAMGNVSSIVDVSLSSIDDITSKSIYLYFEKIDKKVTKLRLDSMPIIDDDALIAIGNISSLQELTLSNLDNVTSDGIINYLSKENRHASTLKVLNIEPTELICDEDIKFLEYVGKLNNVRVESFIYEKMEY